MVHWALPLLLVAALLASPLRTRLDAAPDIPQAAALEFDVASIKRNTGDRPTAGPPSNPAAGQLTLGWVPARFLATRAYPDLTVPLVVDGLPAWADSERWDVTVRFRPGATAPEQAEMWKTLLADRMKLRAHYETRPRPAYKLVVARADRRLGPQMKPSTLDCPDSEPAGPPPPATDVREIAMAVLSQRREPTPQEEQILMSQCRGSSSMGTHLYAGAADMKTLLLSIRFLGRLDRPIVDETGLTGRYTVKLWAAPPAAISAAGIAPALPGTDDAPTVFSALPDQLGLKLEPTTIAGQVLVVDHIERPTEN